MTDSLRAAAALQELHALKFLCQELLSLCSKGRASGERGTVRCLVGDVYQVARVGAL